MEIPQQFRDRVSDGVELMALGEIRFRSLFRLVSKPTLVGRNVDYCERALLDSDGTGTKGSPRRFLTYEAEKIPRDKSEQRRDPCRGCVLDRVDCS